MIIDHIMTKDVHACHPEDTLERAAQIFWEHDCGCVPVIDKDRHVVGMLTDRDSCIAAYTRGSRLSDLRVADAMAKKVHSCKTTDPVSAAESLMRANRIRRVPIVDNTQRLAGILSLNDIAREAARERTQTRPDITEKEVAETLSTICSPRAPMTVA